MSGSTQSNQLTYIRRLRFLIIPVRSPAVKSRHRPRSGIPSHGFLYSIPRNRIWATYRRGRKSQRHRAPPGQTIFRIILGGEGEIRTRNHMGVIIPRRELSP